MKAILFLLLVAGSLALGAVAVSRSAGERLGLPSYYRNPAFNYEILVPAGASVDDSIPELAYLRTDKAWLRINAGCFDFGLENLVRTSLVLELNGTLVTREEYYSDSVLRLRRLIMTNRGTCFALELYSDTDAGWEVLEEAVKGFRFTGGVESQGGIDAFLGCGGCMFVYGAGVGWPAVRHQAGP